MWLPRRTNRDHCSNGCDRPTRPRRSRRPRPARRRGRAIVGVDLDDPEAVPGSTEAGPYITPGFVDVHTHGGGGHDVMDGVAGMDGTARHLIRHGVTSFLPTGVTAPIPDLVAYAAAFRTWRAAVGPDVAEPLGFNLEGPFLSAWRKGAHDPTFLRDPADVPFDDLEPLRRRPAADDGRPGAPGRARADRLAPRARRRDRDGPLGLDAGPGAGRLCRGRDLHDPPVQRDDRRGPPGAGTRRRGAGRRHRLCRTDRRRHPRPPGSLAAHHAHEADGSAAAHQRRDLARWHGHDPCDDRRPRRRGRRPAGDARRARRPWRDR